jgi:UDP-N-acetylglucosamine 2-epimerase
MDAGTIVLTGLDPEIVLDSIELVLADFTANSGKYDKICQEYQITNTSWRVLKLILGTAKLSNRWRGVEQKR